MSCGKRSIDSSSTDLHFVKDSLLKYEPPRLILHDPTSEKDHQQRCRATIAPCVQPVSLYDQQLQLLDPYSDLCRPADILDFLFPPVESIDRHHHRYVCHSESSRSESIHTSTSIDPKRIASSGHEIRCLLFGTTARSSIKAESGFGSRTLSSTSAAVRWLFRWTGSTRDYRVWWTWYSSLSDSSDPSTTDEGLHEYLSEYKWLRHANVASQRANQSQTTESDRSSSIRHRTTETTARQCRRSFGECLEIIFSTETVDRASLSIDATRRADWIAATTNDE